MATMQQAVHAWHYLQKLDVLAGRMIGNAEHVRALNMDVFSYAFSVGIRIVVVGFAAAFLTLTLAFIQLLNNEQITVLAAIGVGLCNYVLASWIWDNRGLLSLPLTIELGLVPIIGIVRVRFGLDFEQTIELVLVSGSIIIGMLFALYLTEAVGKLILGAFIEDVSRQFKPTLPQLREQDALTPDELAAYQALRSPRQKRVEAAALGVFFGTSIALCLSFVEFDFWIMVANLTIWLVTTAVFLLLLIPGERQLNRLKKRILERLAAEGKLAPVTREVAAAQHETIGFSLMGAQYLHGKRKPVATDK